MGKIHCPRCGTIMQQRQIEGRSRETCPACQYICYRNPIPAVGVVVALEGRIVLVRRKFEPRKNYWCLPAGYMELGESTEAAAIRECQEESGLLVQIESLLGVYSFGSGSLSGLVIIYAATHVGGSLQAGDDAEEVGTFALDALPSPLAFCTHLQAIEDWRRRSCGPREQPLPAIRARPGMLIRPAHQHDEGSILDLLRLMPHEQPCEGDHALMTAALFHSRVRDPDSPILVAAIDGSVVGFVTLSFSRGLLRWRAAIHDLVVSAAHRRRGVGHALVQAAISLAQTRQCHILHADGACSTPAVQSFYRSCGFASGDVPTIWLR